MQLVAPAGSLSALKAAVDNGADAVYLGMPQFGARAKAENFDSGTLRGAIEYAHIFGTKVFITLNTLIKDGEMRAALDVAEFVYDQGADAAIVQDIRFIEKLKSALPDFVLHASTQMGIHNADGAKVLYDLGIRRAVLARETLPEDIVEIKKTGLETEFFVQGALCVCFSGNCYFSSLASSYSGNRGKCMQLCRKPYKLGGRNGYFLSAKDLCLYDKLSELEMLGVDAIKIEGRMRSDAYVAQAVRTYKSQMSTEKAIKSLKSVFNRGDYCNAYLDMDAQFNVIYDKSQANIGILVGKIDAVRGNALSVRGFHPHEGDGFKILRDGIEIGGAEARGGEIVCNCKCRAGDALHRTSDAELAKTLSAYNRKLPTKIAVKIHADSKPCATLSASKVVAEVSGDTVAQAALSRAVTLDDVERSFAKTADYPFMPSIELDTDGRSFMPVSALNEFRRKAYDALYKKIVDGYIVNRSADKFKGLNYTKFDGRGTILQVESLDDVDDEIAAKADFIALSPRDYSTVSALRPNFDNPILLNLPMIMRGGDRNVIESAIRAECVSAVISNNYYALKMTDKPILLGYGHNIIGECDLPHVRSFESDCDRADDSWTYVFGYAPVMTLCHCPYGKCINCSGDDILEDESGRKFAMRRYNIAHCYWQLLNCAPHNLLVGMGKTYKNKFYDCTALRKDEIKAVLDGKFDLSYTRGNVNRGLK